MSGSAEKPSIVVILCDQMKAAALGCYGNTACETPSLSHLAARGVLFDNAFTPHPLCVPARVSLWTGQYPHQHGCRRNQTLMPAGQPNLFRTWKDMGYRCGFVGKNHCFRDGDFSLFDVWNEIDHLGIPKGAHHAGADWIQPVAAIAAAHAHRRDMPRQTGSISYAVTDHPIEHYGTSIVAEQSIRFIEESGKRPFALWVSFPDPHTPIEAPARYVNRIPMDQIALPPSRVGELDAAPERTRILRRWHGWEEADTGHVRNVIRIYSAMCRFIDDAVGRIMDALDRAGLARETIVVFCADHGDFTGEHGIMDKGGAFYDCLTRVPLIVSWPGRVPEGRVDGSMVNLVDIAPTLLRLQGADITRSMAGAALPTVTDTEPREAAFSEYGAGGPFFTMAASEKMADPFRESLQWREAEGRRKMVRTAEWKYIHDPMGDGDELYDLRADPSELENLASNPRFARAIASMQRRLADWCALTEDATPVPLPEAVRSARGGMP